MAATRVLEVPPHVVRSLVLPAQRIGPSAVDDACAEALVVVFELCSQPRGVGPKLLAEIGARGLAAVACSSRAGRDAATGTAAAGAAWLAAVGFALSGPPPLGLRLSALARWLRKQTTQRDKLEYHGKDLRTLIACDSAASTAQEAGTQHISHTRSALNDDVD